MNITILTAGSRGDVQPYVALGAGLLAAGHRVVIATHHGFQDMIKLHGLEFAEVSQPPTTLSSSKVWRRWQQSGDNLVHYLTGFYRVARIGSQVIERMLDDFWTASQKADLVISSTSGFGGPQVTAALRIPHCWALFQPMSRTRSFPHFMTPSGLKLSPQMNYLTYIFAERFYWILFKPTLNHWRKKMFGWEPLRRPEPDTFIGEQPSLTLYGFSGFVIPPPHDWGENIKVCGYWQMDPPAGWQPPNELVTFLAQRRPPIYFHLNRINFSPRDKLVKMVLEALQKTQQRGLLYMGHSDLKGHTLPESTLQVPPVPHDWLFPQVAAVVHHGGAGTTASALRAGVPAVGIPGFWDQPFWSKRISALGVGPPPIPIRQLIARRLADAIHTMVNNQKIRARAKELGKQIQQELGVQRAISHLDALLVQPNEKRN